MEIKRLTASQEFYDELWCDLLKTQYNIIVKPKSSSRHTFSWTNPQADFNNPKSFKKDKPEEFKYCDSIQIKFEKHGLSEKIIQLADNRMLQGDYRYGFIKRQNLSNYNTYKEYWRRIHRAKNSQNLELLVDAYNMIRIWYYRTKNKKHHQLLSTHLNKMLAMASIQNWKFWSEDDGEHAIEE